MSLGADYIADHAFEMQYPFGVPGSVWTTKGGQKIKLTDMSEHHIKNCMRIVKGRDNEWHGVFANELKRRKEHKKALGRITGEWETKDGKFIPIAEMSRSHIEKCLAMLRKKPWANNEETDTYDQIQAFERELAERDNLARRIQAMKRDKEI